MNMNLKIITAANKNIGFGHLRRMKTLAHSLLKHGYNLDVELIESEGINVKDFFNFSETKNEKPDCVIFDHHHGLDQFIKDYKNKNIKTIALDYFSNNENADLTINIFEHYKPIPSGFRKTGFEYVMLREDLIPHKNKTKDLDYVLIIIGGADIKGESLEIAQSVSKMGYKVKLVYGPLVEKKNLNLNNVEVYSCPENLVELMANCKFAISNAGSTLFELTFLKKPVWVVPQSEFEQNIANYFFKNNWILGIGNKIDLNHNNISFDHFPITEFGAENIVKEIKGIL